MPQPIDPSTEVLRITAAERIQQIADRTSLAAQARAADQAVANRAQSEGQVTGTQQKSEQVEKELRRRNPYQGRRKRKDQDEAEQEQQQAARVFYTADEKKEIVDDNGEHGLDVTI